jgi:hypothetical protein
MGAINLNNSEEFIKETKIFNDGKVGVVENVRVRIEKKNPGEGKKPDYIVYATDSIGEVHEGYFYQQPDSKGFTQYQAQRLIRLAEGVLGKDAKDIPFPVYNTPAECLDGIMTMVAPILNKNIYRVAVAFGTTRKPSQYLGFKTFGSFIQPMSVPNSLALSSSDCTTRVSAPAATAASKLISSMGDQQTPREDLNWMNSNSSAS